jgi:hypothetical protein
MKRAMAAMVAILATVVIGVIPAAALPQLTGSYSISGNFQWVDSTGAAADVTTATALDFRANPFIPTPGVAGPFQVNSSTGNFAVLGFCPGGACTVGSVKDFSYVGAGNASFPAPNGSTQILAFETVGGFTFDLLALTSVVAVGGTTPTLDIRGFGTFHAAGFADSPGLFVFSGQASGGAFSFSASQSTPEPATMLLLGTGLLGLGIVARKRK